MLCFQNVNIVRQRGAMQDVRHRTHDSAGDAHTLVLAGTQREGGRAGSCANLIQTHSTRSLYWTRQYLSKPASQYSSDLMSRLPRN